MEPWKSFARTNFVGSALGTGKYYYLISNTELYIYKQPLSTSICQNEYRKGTLLYSVNGANFELNPTQSIFFSPQFESRYGSNMDLVDDRVRYLGPSVIQYFSVYLKIAKIGKGPKITHTPITSIFYNTPRTHHCLIAYLSPYLSHPFYPNHPD